jgi:hypothetical protein
VSNGFDREISLWCKMLRRVALGCAAPRRQAFPRAADSPFIRVDFFCDMETSFASAEISADTSQTIP